MIGISAIIVDMIGTKVNTSVPTEKGKLTNDKN